MTEESLNSGILTLYPPLADLKTNNHTEVRKIYILTGILPTVV